jgi:hypothetical protein
MLELTFEYVEIRRQYLLRISLAFVTTALVQLNDDHFEDIEFSMDILVDCSKCLLIVDRDRKVFSIEFYRQLPKQ